MKQLLSSETLQSVKEFFITKIYAPTKEFLTTKFFPTVKEFFTSKFLPFMKQLLESEKLQSIKNRIPEKVRKLLLPGLVLILLLIIGLSRCSTAPAPTPEQLIGDVCVEVLDVHKKPKSGSRVLGQLPYDLEVEILEEKTVKETTWGRIDPIKLPDGSTVKAGWVDLSCIDFSPDVIVEELPAPEPEPEIPSVEATMGTVTADKLNIRKGPGSKFDADGAYCKGDRVEIHETETVDGTVWGHTNLGWVGMGYIRMDGTYTSDTNAAANPDAPKVISDGNTAVLGYGVVNLRELNVRLGPGTQYGKARTVAAGVRYAYYQLVDGWARMEDGWVSTDHFYIEGTVTDAAIAVTVTTDELNIRSGPDTSFRNVGKYTKGQVIEIMATVDDWGYTAQGWVFMNYVEPVKPVYSPGGGTIANGLNIRQEPSAESEIVDTYTTGDRVEVLEVMDNWGRTDKGWINLKYVIFDNPVPTVPATIPETTPATT